MIYDNNGQQLPTDDIMALSLKFFASNKRCHQEITNVCYGEGSFIQAHWLYGMPYLSIIASNAVASEKSYLEIEDGGILKIVVYNDKTGSIRIFFYSVDNASLKCTL